MGLKSVLCASAGMSLALSAVTAHAQTAAAPQGASGDQAPAKSSTAGIQEIVVTAERRETSVQKTPVSMQVYSGADLVKRGVTDMTALANSDSSVNISYSTGQPIVAVRGVSSQNATEIGDPAVSVATDGTFSNRPYGLFGGLYDVERVEVLRGPQGTLFGRNSTGGTINIIDARPTTRDEGRLTFEAGNYNQIAADGFANMALSEGLQARASFQYRSHDGYRSNAPSPDRGDDEDIASGRFQLAFQPTEHLSGWVLAQYTFQGGVGVVSQIIPFSYISGTSGEPVHGMPTRALQASSFPVYNPNAQRLHTTDVRGSLVYKFNGGISLTYLGSYSKITYRRDVSQNAEAYGYSVDTPSMYTNTERPETINQELRLASSPTDRLNWQVGGFFFHEASSLVAYTAVYPRTSFEQRGIMFDEPDITSTSKALYGQAGYNLTDTLKVTAGGRYTWDNKARTGSFYIYPLTTHLPFTITQNQAGQAQSSKFTWQAGLDYQFTPHNLLYGKVSTGYKAGGFNDATSVYGPETVTSYEIGSKNRFLSNHLQFNLAGFWMDYKNQQVSQFVAGLTSSGSMTVNAGSSRIYGLESNIVWQDDALGKLDISANYTHARYLEFTSSAGWDTTGTINRNLAGNRLPLSPTFSLSGSYEHPVALPNGATLTPRAILKYESRKYFSADNFADETQAPYAKLDLGLDYAPASGKWLLQAYVKNVTNKVIFIDATEFYLFNNYTYSYEPPRTYGVRLTVNFK